MTHELHRVHVFVCLSAGLNKNYQTDLHQTLMEEEQNRTEQNPVAFGVDPDKRFFLSFFNSLMSQGTLRRSL